jgi:hypothetical protein
MLYTGRDIDAGFLRLTLANTTSAHTTSEHTTSAHTTSAHTTSAHTQTEMHLHTLTHKHTHTYTRTRTHAHTHSRSTELELKHVMALTKATHVADSGAWHLHIPSSSTKACDSTNESKTFTTAMSTGRFRGMATA